MAQAMASMSRLLEGSLQLSGSSRLGEVRISRLRVGLGRTSTFVVKAHQGSAETETSRRAVLGLVAVGLGSGAFVQAALADPAPIKIGPPPPPFGGLPGTENSDEARDLDLPLNKRFFLQPLTPTAAAERVKESAQDIVNVKPLIEKKAWSYVQSDLRSKAEYLRYDLNTVISAKPKEQKVALKALTGKLFQDISNLDHAAKIKSSTEAAKYYDTAVSTLKDVLANLG